MPRLPVGCSRILTVARLHRQKGIDVAIDVAYKLKKASYCFVWYVVGEGTERSRLEAKIRLLGLEHEFILLGAMTNPFGCYASCDIYVQPSRYEGHCLTLEEASAFAKPIVTVDFAGATERMVDGITALIVKFGVEQIFRGVEMLICNKDLCRELSRNLKMRMDRSKAIQTITSKLLS